MDVGKLVEEIHRDVDYPSASQEVMLRSIQSSLRGLVADIEADAWKYESIDKHLGLS